MKESYSQNSYYKQLDALRFFSVASVMIAHWIAWDTQNFWLKTLHWGNGVIFFFVLSGFLITEILLNQKQEILNGEKTIFQSLKTFYIRRTLRIFPIYYLLIFFLFLINYKNTREIFPYLATYTSNILQAKTNEYVGDFNHFWSLAVEEQFYIFWPLCLFLIKQKHMLKFIVATIIFSLASRLYYTLNYPDKWMAASYLTNNVMFALSIGAFLSFLKYKKHSLFARLSNSKLFTPVGMTIYLCSFLLIVHKNYFPAFNFLFDEFLFSVLSMGIIARCTGPGYSFLGKWLLENPVFKHLGQISYGLYLFHLFAIPTLYAYIAPHVHLPENKQVAWFMFFTLTWIISELSYYFIEKPISQFKNRFKY